jgi:hypothetical protein
MLVLLRMWNSLYCFDITGRLKLVRLCRASEAILVARDE